MNCFKITQIHNKTINVAINQKYLFAKVPALPNYIIISLTSVEGVVEYKRISASLDGSSLLVTLTFGDLAQKLRSK